MLMPFCDPAANATRAFDMTPGLGEPSDPSRWTQRFQQCGTTRSSRLTGNVGSVGFRRSPVAGCWSLDSNPLTLDVVNDLSDFPVKVVVQVDADVGEE